MKDIKKITSTNLLTISKKYLIKNGIKNIPNILDKVNFIKYYNYIYSVREISKNTIEVKFLDENKLNINARLWPKMSGLKILAIPQVNRLSVNQINLHIPAKYIKKFQLPYWEINYIGNYTLYLTNVSKQIYIKSLEGKQWR